jgi:plasmid maintenance system killer protein
MEILLSKEFKENFSRLELSVQKKAEKQIMFFASNPFYPSLNTEKLAPSIKEIWSFRVDRKYRVIFRFLEKNNALFLTIGPHDWVYRINF